jgi:hypothetical protein
VKSTITEERPKIGNRNKNDESEGIPRKTQEIVKHYLKKHKTKTQLQLRIQILIKRQRIPTSSNSSSLS